MTPDKAQLPAKADIFADFPEDKFNRLLPSQAILNCIGPMHKASVDVVHISPNKDDGDVYPQEGGRLAFTKIGLARVAHAAGIIWHPELSSKVEERTKTYCRVRALALMKKSDGTFVSVPGLYEIDLDDLREELNVQYKKKVGAVKKTYKSKDWNWPGDDAWIESKVEQEWMQKRKHIVRFCEAGAMNAAIREMLAIRNYTAAELSKPFAVLRVNFAPDASDPEVKRLLLEKATGAVSQLYPPDHHKADSPHAPAIENGHVEELHVAPEDDGLDAALDADPPPNELDAQLATFKAMDPPDQANAFVEVVKHKALDMGTKAKPSELRQAWRENRAKAYRIALEMGGDST